ncbi:TonB-dependent receptor [Acanthopleuribacter pedis]|uniref:TonB-dependent receptor n=1 Tax=Acanthopleuribacter pedis TaxID=442870 RepID=A0A8J7QDR3_9BACT|nr:TonB-dependent receptor [Acanthopleuribacter pedis]MBO1322677.1 TonB-dependent receptor [Acanthopleuribacter pedis]
MNTRLSNVVFGVMFAALFAFPAFAQQTGNINGSVEDANGEPLPGVVITLESPALQGTRTAVSAETGQYLVRLLPAGIYTVTATMPGMKTVKLETRVSIGTTTRPKMVMEPEGTSEVLVVVADRVFELDTTQVATNFEGDFVEKLPRARDLQSVARLAPGVTTGAFGGISINGASATENVFMLNGAFVNGDGIRGRADNLFIEDDIQETQVITGNASAEFGFFAGGVVNSITKSGSNEFHGTFRASLSNEDWLARDPLELEAGTEKVDTINKEYTFTFNGPIVKDRLWFAVAGRSFDTDETESLRAGTALSDAQATALGLPTGQTAPPARGYTEVTERQRLQLKLTGTIAEGHQVVASYLEDEVDVINRQTFVSIGTSALDPAASFPGSLLSLNYRGIITPAFTVDANYSERTGELGGGLITDDIIAGTTLIHRDQGNAYSNAPFGGGGVAERNSENWNLKFSYFYNSTNLGSHDITFGAQSLTETRNENNFQSPTGWQLRPRWTRFDANGEPIPIFQGDGTVGGSAWFVYFPVVNLSQGSDFTTEALFVNDVWTLNENWYFNIGARFDRNDTAAEDGQELSATDNFSPRLTVNYDPRGDGVHQFSLGYNVYTGKLNDAAQDGSTAGSPAIFAWIYDGPQTESIADVYAWLESAFPGGRAAVEALDANAIQNPYLFFQDFSPDTSFESLSVVPQAGGLDALDVTEISLGYKHKLGNRGFVKSDVIIREYGSFLIGTIDTTTGQNTFGVDRTVLSNCDDCYEREYFGINLSGQYKFENEITFGGNYTYSQAEGNINGETSGSGAISTERTTTYPEYAGYSRANPTGLLPENIEHTLRMWAGYDLNTSFGTFNFTGLFNYFSGIPYGMQYNVQIGGRETEYGFPDPATLPYSEPPTEATYHVTDPDAFEFDSFTSLDLAVNYSFTIQNRYELFVQFEVTNMFNGDAQIDGNQTVTAISGAPSFDIFNETPVEGIHYERGGSFGEGTLNQHFQAPREMTIDLGIRF